MTTKFQLFSRIFFGIFLLVIYCEYFIYFIIINNCDWPKLDPSTKEPDIQDSDELPVKAMFIADTHLLGTRYGHWFDKLRREWQMHRAFQTAMILHNPDVVFVLGDLTDEGMFCSRRQFKYYVERFYDLFSVPENTQMYIAVGNHDIGFHYEAGPRLYERFEKSFKSPAVQLVTIRGNNFVIINSMALEGDGCNLCKPAEEKLANISNVLKCTKGVINCDPNMRLEKFSRPILLQHFPLYRESDMECDDFDAAPLVIKQELFREKWECLSKESTNQLLSQIRPRLALSGHTHHGCTRSLPTGDGLEITIPSFSWRNKENPNFGLAVFVPNNYAFVKCEMPKENHVILMYILGCTLLLLWLFYALYQNIQYRKKLKVK